jgi:predicted dehydrogenase
MRTLKFDSVIETEDTLASVLLYENGAIGTLNVTTASNVRWDARIEIAGTEGSIGFTLNHPGQVIRKELSPAAERCFESELKRNQVNSHPPAGRDYYGISHRTQARRFLDAALNGEEQVNPPEDATNTLRLVQDIYRIARGK